MQAENYNYLSIINLKDYLLFREVTNSLLIEIPLPHIISNITSDHIC